MNKEKYCGNCKYSNFTNKRFWCIPCKRGKYIRDNWAKKEERK